VSLTRDWDDERAVSALWGIAPGVMRWPLSADASNRADVPRFTGRVTELAPQLRHVEVDDVVVAAPVEAPDGSEELGPSEERSRVRSSIAMPSGDPIAGTGRRGG